MRVFCNFESKLEQAYAYINNDNIDMSSRKKIEYWCASIGLEPVQIDVDHVETIIQYLNDIGVDMMNPSPIPLGYDYMCEEGQPSCEGKFYSFNNQEESDDISNKLISLLDPKNIQNMPFSIQGKLRDGIGIAMSKEKLVRINVEESSMKGLVCSTNKVPGMVRPTSLSVGCDTKVRGNSDF